jgi:thiol-disulfide isomerase/thioredoxin
MGKASRTHHRDTVQHRHEIAVRQAAARRAQVRNRLLLAGGSVLAVVVVVLALFLVKAGSKSTPTAPPSDGPTGAALASVTGALTGVPASVLDAVGAGSISQASVGTASTSGSGYLTSISGPPLTSAGKPEVFYLGADFCPYCAAVRWPLIVALSRFGTFSGLSTVRSAITDGTGRAEPYPATPTWTFFGSRYTSQYLTFVPVELQTNVPDPKSGGYTSLQSMTAEQQDLAAKYDPSMLIPFIDMGNTYVQMSSLAPFGPQDLQHLTWSQIAAALHDPSSTLAKGIGGTANYLTAGLCKLTGNQPASACTPAVRALESRLP